MASSGPQSIYMYIDKDTIHVSIMTLASKTVTHNNRIDVHVHHRLVIHVTEAAYYYYHETANANY